MKTEKMIYEKPTVQKVEFDYKTGIAASGCTETYCSWCNICDN